MGLRIRIMKSNWRNYLILSGCISLLSNGLGCAHPSSQALAEEPDALGSAFAEFSATLASVEDSIRASASFRDSQEEVGGYRHMLRSMAKSLEAEVIQDSDYPYFRILDFWLREGGDNPDQRYAFSPIRGGVAYRVWGKIGSAARVELQIYSGRPWAGDGRSAGYLRFEDIAIDDDGAFEIIVSAEKSPGNWLKNPDDSTTLFARHIYDDWSDADTGEIHIDRVGYEGSRRIGETPEELAQRIRDAAAMFKATAESWPAFVARRYVAAAEPNSVTVPRDTYALGGVRGRWMSGGYFSLEHGEAVLLRMPASEAKYQGIQLTDMWFASLEHGNQVSSLNTRQSLLSPDGAYYYVISQEDPGFANWLDAGALVRGTFLLRWDGVDGALAPEQFPSAETIFLEQVEEKIPGFVQVGEGERESIRSQRRRHLQRRSHR